MDRTDKIEWLKRYLDAEQEISRLTEEIQRLRSSAERITPLMSDVPGGGDGDGNRIERFVEKVSEIQESILQSMDRQHAVKLEIESVIATVPSAPHKQLLRLCYINGKDLKRVAEYMNYSHIWAKKEHSKALDAIDMTNVYTPIYPPL